MKQKLAIVLTVLFPGTGQALLGRPVNGLMLFTVFALSLLLAGARLVAFETPSVFEDRLLCLAIGAGGAAWVCALVETLQLARQGKRLRTQADRDRHIRNGMVLYLKGEFGQAREAFERALALDGADGDARFHLAMALKAQGLRRQAVRVLRRCLALDPDSKWRFEISEELEKLSS